jgi:hypothetical protein
MPANETQLRFIQHVMPAAQAAASHLGIPVSVVLAQWLNETGAGTSRAWLEGHNYAGVSFLEPYQEQLGARLGGEGEILFYPDEQAGLAGYIGRWGDGVYDATRNLWREAKDAHAVAAAIEASPWAAGHYGGNGLRALIDELNLTQFDGGAHPAQPPVDGPAVPCGALRPGPAPEGHTTLRVGAHGDEVREVQLRLHEAGYPPGGSLKSDGTYDGIFGSGTAQAVADFQTLHGLHRDGIVGRQTWCALGVR